MKQSATIDIPLSMDSLDDYRTFIKAKQLPKYAIHGGFVRVPREYAGLLGSKTSSRKHGSYTPPTWLFDYQRDITSLALEKKKYAVFADCGLGKTPIILEFAREALKRGQHGRVLIVSPLMVCRQSIEESGKFYPGENFVSFVPASGLREWLKIGKGIAITNYEAITDDLESSGLDGLILDESSMLKSHYGAWGTRLIELGRGVEYKLCATGTPAPNDRIEYANHAVFLDAFPTVNSFLARFFVNRGQTNERWELKAHALKPFFTALSHWCIFLTNPATYGWKDNCGTLPPIHVHTHRVPLTHEQRSAFMDSTGSMFMAEAGGIGTRGKIARIGKGFHNGEKIESRKTAYIADLVKSWPSESTIIWCKYNQEQESIADAIPDAGNISGDTPIDERERIVADFKAGKIRTLITKPKILGFGLNLQIATRQLFSGLQDSYEEYYQAVKRSNRYGSTKALSVHIPITELEEPMVQTVLTKAARVQSDTEEQERMFYAIAFRK